MITSIIVFIFGLTIGSLINVCIYRIPRGISIITPSSRCPSCGTPIKFYDNIPVISYILLRGKCRFCKGKISLRYPFVELLNAILYTAVLQRFGSDSILVLLVYFLFLSSLVTIFFIDLEHQIIPDSITLPGIPLALLFGITVLPDPFARLDSLGIKSSITGAMLGGGLFYLIAILGRALLKKDAMGGGDIKLMAMIGGFLGWKGVILTTLIGSLTGSIAGILLMIIKGKRWGSRIPFGPYLAIAAIISLFWGQEIIRWYLYGG